MAVNMIGQTAYGQTIILFSGVMAVIGVIRTLMAWCYSCYWCYKDAYGLTIILFPGVVAVISAILVFRVDQHMSSCPL